MLRYQVVGWFQRDLFIRPAFSQRQKGVPVSLARGDILDRHGVPLHDPVWGSAVALFPSEVTDAAAVQAAIASLTGGQSRTFRSPQGEDTPVKILRGLESGQAEALVEAGLPAGIEVVPEEARYGPGSLACHVVGHVRENAYVDPADNVGESGLERTFDNELRGGDPAWAGVVATGDGSGLPGSGIRIAPALDAPPDLRTTIDASVQIQVERALDEGGVKKGAAVVLDMKSGELLAMASRPTFDQNHPEKSLADPDAPFVNRAISAFTPGSVFKPVIMSLALEAGYVRPDETFTCAGEVKVGARTISCGHDKKGHGQVTPAEALALSCNSALIQIALRIDPEVLVEYATKCGFGSTTGVPLPDESRGTLPHPYSMWAGDVANLAIGQGPISATPLQIAAFFRAIAAGGEYVKPVLVSQSSGDAPAQKRLFSEATAELLQEALLKTTTEGTGQLAWVPVRGSAGKTGTAETGPATMPHAWFCGWTPLIAPRYVICVFVEEGGDGPSVAAPVFRDIASRIQP